MSEKKLPWHQLSTTPGSVPGDWDPTRRKKPRNEPDDPLHVIIRRKRIGREIRSALYLGQASKDIPYGRELLWAKLVQKMQGDGYFNYGELLHLAEEFAQEIQLPRPADFQADPDLHILQAYERYLWLLVREEGRWRFRGKAKEDRLLDRSKQALLDGFCPWCGGDLPCQDHKMPKVVLDGQGNLQEST